MRRKMRGKYFSEGKERYERGETREEERKKINTRREISV